jgi:hypothetical protein
MVWADSPGDSSSPLTPYWRWVMDNCVSNRQVAMHFQLSIPRESFFTQPIFHWTTPLDYPRHLPDACFFYQGRFLGSGKDGFESMLKEITRLRPASTYILGSQYTDKSPRVYIPMMPFEKELRRLDDLTREIGSSLTCLEYGWLTNR